MPNPTSKLNLVINGTTTQLDIHDSNAVDLTSNQTVAGNKEFTGTTTAHDVIPSATDTYNFGGPSYQWNNAYIKSLTINGVAAGDILTHNASEFVGVSGDQTVGGEKTFSNLRTYFGRDISCYSRVKYGKNLNPTSISYQYLVFDGNTVSDGPANDWNGGYIEQVVDTNGGSRGRWFVQDTSGNNVGLELWASGNDKQVRPFQNSNTDLGTSTKKWKSFNGVEPSDLSLPSDTSITIDTTSFAWGKNFTFTPSVNGYLFINIGNTNGIKSLSLKSGRGEYYFSNQTNILRFTMPVYKNKLVTILVSSSSAAETIVPGLLLYPLQGNV